MYFEQWRNSVTDIVGQGRRAAFAYMEIMVFIFPDSATWHYLWSARSPKRALFPLEFVMSKSLTW